jgi:hypothetical protein
MASQTADIIFAEKVFENSRNILTNKNKSSDIIAHNSNAIYAIPTPLIGHIICCIPPNGIIINTAGTYILSKNIYWESSQSAIAITITSNNVNLNMNGYKIKNKNKCDHRRNKISTIGIAMIGQPLQQLNNVTLHNGYVDDMNYHAIQCINCVNLSISDITICSIELDNLDIRNLTPSGIYLQYCSNFRIHQCDVNDLNVTTDSCAGIQIIESLNGIISKCRLNNFVNIDGAVQGYSYIGCMNITTLDCKSNEFRSYFNGNILTTGHTVLGFCPILCQNLLYEKCEATNIYGSCDDAHGVSIFLNIYVQMNNCYIENVWDGVTETKTGAKSTGIEVYGIYVSVNNCVVKNIYAIRPQDMQCSGFSVAGIYVTFTNCIAENVKVLDKCNYSDTKYGRGVGYGWAPDPRPEFVIINASFVTYTNCMAKNCQVGFDDWFHNNSTWNCIESLKCLIPIFNCQTNRTLSCNACSECNPLINIVITNNAHNNIFSCVKCDNICHNNKY